MHYPIVPSPEGEGYKLQFIEPPIMQPGEIVPVLDQTLARSPKQPSFGAFVIRRAGIGTFQTAEAHLRSHLPPRTEIKDATFEHKGRPLHTDPGLPNDLTLYYQARRSVRVAVLAGSQMRVPFDSPDAQLYHRSLFTTGILPTWLAGPPARAYMVTLQPGDALGFDHTQPHTILVKGADDRLSQARYLLRQDDKA
jgi:hypothetical protein